MKDTSKVINALLLYKDLNVEEKEMFLAGTGLCQGLGYMFDIDESIAELRKLKLR